MAWRGTSRRGPARGRSSTTSPASSAPRSSGTADQLRRACLEDVVMAKLHGLTMGLDVCATFHMGIPPRSPCTTRHGGSSSWPRQRTLMAVAGNADPMLGALHHVVPRAPAPSRSLREDRITTGDERSARGARRAGGRRCRAHTPRASLYAALREGRRRSTDDGRAVTRKALAKIENLRARGYDVGCGPRRRPRGAGRRRHAAWRRSTRRPGTRCTPRWTIGVLQDVAPEHVSVRSRVARPRATTSPTRDPENRFATTMRSGSSRLVARAARGARRLQVVISDGLNANAAERESARGAPAAAR